MNNSNTIALILGGIGFVISIITLVFSPRIALKSKRLEKRLEYRFELFQKILELWEFTHKSNSENDVKPLMLEINKLIQLYGYNSEINSFKELMNFYNYYAQNQGEDNRQKLITKFNTFFSISFNAYRKEIVLGKLVD
ncbi:hypothetical protein [Flavobacterium sp. N502540]|uniref:hypothetical protein n=1 Tax=Flavobacterium sp. N502540 TaxID=2986838 RepID=UPI0022243846|nr:hypothetical protein [Flavobacterium sp. N502540]